MPVGLICQTRPSCGETRLPHVGYEQFTLRSGRLPVRSAAGGSAPAAGAGCCAAGRAGATAIATAIAHAAPINDRMFWLTLSPPTFGLQLDDDVFLAVDGDRPHESELRSGIDVLPRRRDAVAVGVADVQLGLHLQPLANQTRRAQRLELPRGDLPVRPLDVDIPPR